MDARAQLAKLKRTDLLAARIDGVARLLPDIGRRLRRSGRSDRWIGSRFFLSGSERDDILALAKAVESLDEIRRSELFRLTFGALAPAAEMAWSRMSERSYTPGYPPLPFRAPGDARTVSAMRGFWLNEVFEDLLGFDATGPWVVEWGHAIGCADALSWLLACEIDRGGEDGERVFQALRSRAVGDRDPVISGDAPEMNGMALRVILTSGRRDGWEWVTSLLLAAQRQEGLRQVILCQAPFAGRDAFRYILGVIRDHDLLRFSSVASVINQLFGLMWDSVSQRVLRHTIDMVITYLDDPAARRDAVGTSSDTPPDDQYLALWTEATEDACAAIERARPLLSHDQPERRYVAVHLIALTTLTDHNAGLLTSMLDDPDPRIAARVLMGIGAFGRDDERSRARFDAILRLLSRAPAKTATMPPIVWPWAVHKLDRRAVADALIFACDEDIAGLLPHIPDMSPSVRAMVVRHMTGQARPDWWMSIGPRRRFGVPDEYRPLVLESLGDASPDVRAVAFAAMSRQIPRADEVERLVQLLERKPGDLRKLCIERLLRLTDDEARSIGKRLAEDRNSARRQAGAEVLTMVAARAGAAEARNTEHTGSQAGVARPRKPSKRATRAGEADPARPPSLPETAPTLDDALGLLRHDPRPAPPAPRACNEHMVTSATKAFLRAYANEFLLHADAEINDVDHVRACDIRIGPQREPLPEIDPLRSPEDDAARVPMIEHWKRWLDELPRSAVDADGLTLVRAYTNFYPVTRNLKPQIEAFESISGWMLQRTAEDLLGWLIRAAPPPEMFDLVLDRLESSLASQAGKPKTPRQVEAVCDAARCAIGAIWSLRRLAPHRWTSQHALRRLNLMRWAFQNSDRSQACLLGAADLIEACASGVAGEEDLIENLIGSRRDVHRNWQAPPTFSTLHELTGLRPPQSLTAQPGLLAVVDRVRARVIDVEIARGELDTAASLPASRLRLTGGLAVLERALAAIGPGELARRQWNSDRDTPTRGQSLTHMIRGSFPAPGDTTEAFTSAVERLGLKQRRLIEVGVLAPQWASHVEAALGWPGLAEACWWIHAHTKPAADDQADELGESWAAHIAERTAVTAEDLAEGAVDVAWFARMHSALGDQRWTEVDRAAKYASNSAGHTRARLFAAAMLGHAARDELEARARKTRHPDSVRAIGLLPLPDRSKDRDAEVLARYEFLQEFLRQSRKFGSQRQATEKRAVEIAMANLARAAGYPDPIRLQWAMETRVIGDLAKGPIVIEANGARAVLSINESGAAELSITKNDKPVKSVPTALKRHEGYAGMKAQATALGRQVARMRLSLEEAMCRGDEFTGREIRSLFGHPSLRAMLERLVLIGDGILGYAAAEGRALRNHAGVVEPIKPDERLWLAHPVDLLSRGDWSKWQAECCAAERIQPFKQVFRELYPRTGQEPDDSTSTRRYAGHQVNPRQAAALLKSRQWVVHPELGIRKTFHAEGLNAHIEIQGDYFTAAAVEGWTLEQVMFTRRGKPDPVPLSAIPPRMFSEVMRDADLVVSVAHRGGVDPEASASTVEMRAALLRETCRLLGLSNVRIEPPRVLIDGTRASYSLHLGSAATAIQPGRSLVIVAVHAAHRGRLFLPFADSDPKTAEVMSKALLLARDHEIIDPTILGQIGR